jgi:hypothetical protein
MPSEPLPLAADVEEDAEVCDCGGGVETGAAVVAGFVSSEDFKFVVVDPVAVEPVVDEPVAAELVVDEPVDVGPAIVDVGPVDGPGVVEV